MTQPDTDDDTVTWLDGSRSAPLDDAGLPGYDAVVAVADDGGECLALARRDLLGGPAPCWPADWRRIAPHELEGRLPKPFAPTCGRTATASGRPCRVRVPSWGDACAHHAHVGAHAERNQPV